MKSINKKGFTLVELLISIAVIAFLMAIATYVYADARMKSRDARRTGDIDGIHKAIQLYMNEQGAAPATEVPNTGECLNETIANNAASRLITAKSIFKVSVDPRWPDAPPSTLNGDHQPVAPSSDFCYYYYKTPAGANYVLAYFTEKDKVIHVITNNQ